MIRLKNLLTEDPDNILKFWLSWYDDDAIAFFKWMGDVHAIKGGGTHLHLLIYNLDKIAPLFPKIADRFGLDIKQVSAPDFEPTIDNADQVDRYLSDLLTTITNDNRMKFSGRFWITDTWYDGKKVDVVMSFWKYPKDKAELVSLLKTIKTPQNYIDDDTILIEGNAGTFMWLSEYRRPASIKMRYGGNYVKQYKIKKHELPPHLR